MTESITVDPRFCGPPRSANGGYISGLLAEELRQRTGHAVATVTLRRPTPLATPLSLRADDDDPAGATLRCEVDGTMVAEVTAGHFEAHAPDPVPYEVAAAAEHGYTGAVGHPFPTCFACGPDREPGDGLRLAPGSVPDRDGTVATAWKAPSAAGIPVVWAALDCSGGWSVVRPERPMLLGQMTAEVFATPVAGGDYVVVGQSRGIDGRKGYTSSALFDHSGGLLARAEATWIQIDLAALDAG
jgi:hypothetical protein